MEQFWSTSLMRTAAGLATGLGSLFAIIREPGKRSCGLRMGGTAGIMITLAFTELMNEAREMAGFLTATLGNSAGTLFITAVEVLIPHMRFGEPCTTSRKVLQLPYHFAFAGGGMTFITLAELIPTARAPRPPTLPGDRDHAGCDLWIPVIRDSWSVTYG